MARALFVHGAGAGAWEWRIWQRVFAARGVGCECIELAPASGGLAATSYCDYLEQVARAARVFKPDLLVGASLGGLLAAEASGVCKPDRLALLAPIPPSGLVGAFDGPVVRWAHDPQLARTRNALPDANAAACAYAHARWRDESALVLREAYRGRAFALASEATLIVVADADSKIPRQALADWAHRAGADFWREPSAGHAGLLLGSGAARLAERVLQWSGLSVA